MRYFNFKIFNALFKFCRSLGDQLKTLKYLYYCLCQSADKLNSSFSFVIWLTVSIKITTLVTSSFFLISSMIQKSSLEQYHLTNTWAIIFDMTYLLIIFLTVDLPAKKVSVLRNLKNEIYTVM